MNHGIKLLRSWKEHLLTVLSCLEAIIGYLPLFFYHNMLRCVILILHRIMECRILLQ